MKTHRYKGTFKSAEGHEYDLEVHCNGFLQAFFLLTAKAIESGRHYQLATIKDMDHNTFRHIDDIIKVSELIS